MSEDVCGTVRSIIRDLFREQLIGPIPFVSAVCYPSYVLLTLPQTHFDQFRWIFSVPENMTLVKENSSTVTYIIFRGLFSSVWGCEGVIKL